MKTAARVIILGLSVIAFVVCAPLCADPKAEAVMEQQRAYFARINAVELRATSTETFNQALEAANGGGPTYPVVKHELALDGARYLCKLSYCKKEGDKPEKTNTYAYDGTRYQQLEGNKTIWVQRASPWPNLYRVWTLVTAPFGFAFDKQDVIAFSALKNPGKWSALLPEVISVEDQVNMLGHKGCRVKFKKPQNGKYLATYTVFFAEDLDYFPIHTRIDYLEPKDDAPRAELTVTQTVRTPEGIVFPAAVQIVDYYKADTRQAVTTITLDTDSLKINRAIPGERFTIPKTEGVRVYDADLKTMLD